uniref:Secreted protein n=1 Tax=Minutocellus polymorphus TaxID=265543 RepID=A0A7S0ARZ5_9STRA|mmetsp:Transcript_2053/g.3460  ORF Transcript_2053/g.3460 Transcript_2053/m.3460 type:complete len:179 (+) Transcript_2053:115-651(+)|eukprot:CAMPEP_0197725096 /NCGR_PEP_ID=MMETSP1434-20131217/6765_1 /TAXON_ID=265543 /ORGANISM="Minutocellus polymorphus, Strain CCMP3303" /LENGTH=178 /DNA_ID=CAMNT_0043310541 /DNA_START=114 /DNA_END=650 /DNA_ORIENTATION=-
MSRLRVHIARVALVVLCSLRANADGFHLGTNTSGSSQSAIADGAKVESVSSARCTFRACSRRKTLEKMILIFGAVPFISPRPSFAEAESGAGELDGSAATKPTTSITTISDVESSSAIDCDEGCKEQRRRKIEERRAMMRQSRSTSSRQEIFELSRQRARLYGTEYQGSNCIDGVPCI